MLARVCTSIALITPPLYHYKRFITISPVDQTQLEQGTMTVDFPGELLLGACIR